MQAGNALLAAVAALLPETAGELHLKWPNDLVMGADPATARKIAGILAESQLAPDGLLSYAILGIGINVNQRSSDLPRIAPPTPRPTSLRLARAQQQTGDETLIDRSALLIQLCQQLAEELSRSPMQSHQQWKSNLATLGHTVAVYQQGVEQPATLTGQAVDVLEDGSLVVVDETGARHTFHAADVSVRAT
jgi:BirA family biotin operon repressor/biotin-[acetyl-CoA-carboxylase] ligase